MDGDEVPRAVSISDIQSSPQEMKGRVYASYVRNNMTYRSETRPYLVDVGLMSERAEMQMNVSMRDRKTSEELRKLVLS